MASADLNSPDSTKVERPCFCVNLEPLPACPQNLCCTADLASARATSDVGGWSGVVHRRLVLTHAGLLERRPGDYEVRCAHGPSWQDAHVRRACSAGTHFQGIRPSFTAGWIETTLFQPLQLSLWCLLLLPPVLHDPSPLPWFRMQVAEWRQLPAIAALVRFGEDPQWLAVEWADGTPTATYVTPARCPPFIVASLVPRLALEPAAHLHPSCVPTCRLPSHLPAVPWPTAPSLYPCGNALHLSCPPCTPPFVAGMPCWLRCWTPHRRPRAGPSRCFASPPRQAK